MLMKFFFHLLILLSVTNMVAQNGIALIVNNLDFSKENLKPSANASFESSFELYDRMIIVEAMLNEIKGKYILDTGSPMLILNQTPHKKSTTLKGVSEESTAELIKVKSFKWAGTVNNEITAIACDMSNLELALGHNIDGLIGQSIFKNFELYLDLSNQKIQLFKSYRSPLHKTRKYQQKISFSNKSHIPIVSIKINGEKYYFGIDTGAEVNVLNKNLKDELGKEELSNFEKSSLHGLGGKSKIVESTNLRSFKIKKTVFKNHQFLLTDLTSFEEKYGQKLDGILGHPFLLQNILSINYRKQKIYFW